MVLLKRKNNRQIEKDEKAFMEEIEKELEKKAAEVKNNEMKYQVSNEEKAKEKITEISEEQNNEIFLSKEKSKVVEKIIGESFLKDFIYDDDLTDIRYNGTFLSLKYSSKPYPVRPEKQPSQEEVSKLGSKIANETGQQFNTSVPRLNVVFSYMRVSFMHESLTTGGSGCTFSIRITKPILKITDIAAISNEDVAKLIEVLTKTEQNMIICGRTGAGKTELQKKIVGLMPDYVYIHLIENTADSHIKELYPQKDIISWQTRTEETRDQKIDMYDEMIEALRNDPDWLIPAEIRTGREAYTLLESALTDHANVTTLHVKRARRTIPRLITMIGNEKNKNELLLGKEIVSVLKFAIYMTYKRTPNGIERYIQEIVEFVDYTEKNGAEYITLYERKKVFNEKTNKYEVKEYFNPLSEETIEDITFKEYYHELPDKFKPKNDVLKVSDLSNEQ